MEILGSLQSFRGCEDEIFFFLQLDLSGFEAIEEWIGLLGGDGARSPWPVGLRREGVVMERLDGLFCF